MFPMIDWTAFSWKNELDEKAHKKSFNIIYAQYSNYFMLKRNKLLFNAAVKELNKNTFPEVLLLCFFAF